MPAAVLEGIVPPPSALKTKKTIHFETTPEQTRQPLVYQLGKQFDIVPNIRGASITEEGGFVALELEGEVDKIERALEYLRSLGIQVEEGLGGTKT